MTKPKKTNIREEPVKELPAKKPNEERYPEWAEIEKIQNPTDFWAHRVRIINAINEKNSNFAKILEADTIIGFWHMKEGIFSVLRGENK